jgi:hypothetical protein
MAEKVFGRPLIEPLHAFLDDLPTYIGIFSGRRE